MALTKCKTCGNDISEHAETCPHCGAPNGTQPQATPQPESATNPQLIQQPVQQPVQQQQYAQQPMQQPEPQPKKNSSKILPLLIILGIVGIGALIAAGYAVYDQFMKPKTTVVTTDEDDLYDDDDESSFESSASRETPGKGDAASGPEDFQYVDMGVDCSMYVCNNRLSESDLMGLSSNQLRLLRNSIYARHGRQFVSEDLQRYFSQFDWYNPYRSEVSVNDLSDIERSNVTLIKSLE